MTTYYVGPGGNDGNAGTSWALRKLTIGGAEAIGLSAGDIVYVAPGTYREGIGLGASGSAGSPIVYEADVTGVHTDGVGGQVRWTGSDDDLAAARQQQISAGARHYRTFRGFTFDMGSVRNILVTNCTNWIIEDCVFTGNLSADRVGIHFESSFDTMTIRRCIFQTPGWSIYINNGNTQAAATDVNIENCIFTHTSYGVYVRDVSDVVVHNCTFMGCYRGMYVTNLASGDSVYLYNSIIHGNYRGVEASSVGQIIEDYNLFGVNSDGSRRNTDTGANSNAYISHMIWPPLKSTFKFEGPLYGFEQAPYSPVAHIAGIGGSEPTFDLFQIYRSPVAARRSWGAAQRFEGIRDTGTVYGGSPASLCLPEASRLQFRIPVDGTEITVSVRVYWESDYAGTKPQLQISQPGDSFTRTTTAAGAAENWELLSDTFTPNAEPGYLIVTLSSNNTAVSGNYDVFFDDLTVT